MAAQLQVWSCPPTVLPAGGRVLLPSCPTVAGTLALLVASCSRGAGPLAGPWHLCIPDSSEDSPPQHWLLHGHHLGASQNQPRTHVSLSGFGRIWVGCPFPRDSPLPSQAHLVCLQFPHGLELPVPLGSTDMSLIWRLPPWMPAPGSCIFRGESWWGLSSYLEVSRLCSPRTTSSGPVACLTPRLSLAVSREGAASRNT